MGESERSFFERYCAQVLARDPLTEEEERILAERWINEGDRRAADALVDAHLPLVIALARRLRGYGVPREELIAEGNVGLLRAVEKFDLRGVRFKTYATYWIRAHMLSLALRSNHVVTQATGALGAHLFFKLRSARAKAETLLGPGNEGIDAHLAEQFGVSEDVIRAHTARLATHDVSLDQPVGEEGDSAMVDLMPSPATDPEAAVDRTERDELVHAVLGRVWKGLDIRERAIVRDRLLSDDGESTLSQLGDRFSLSRERLRQIELRVKERLRRALTESSDDAVH